MNRRLPLPPWPDSLPYQLAALVLIAEWRERQERRRAAVA